MTAEQHRPTPNEIFGANLRTLRERAGMSQAELARAMTERGKLVPDGWSWHQSTVARIEAGRQTVTYWESRALAEILKTSGSRFSWLGPEANETEFVYRAGAVLSQRYEETARAVSSQLAALDYAERVAGGRQDSEYERVREACRDVLARAAEYTDAAAIEEGYRRHDERTAGTEPEELPEPVDGDG